MFVTNPSLNKAIVNFIIVCIPFAIGLGVSFLVNKVAHAIFKCPKKSIGSNAIKFSAVVVGTGIGIYAVYCFPGYIEPFVFSVALLGAVISVDEPQSVYDQSRFSTGLHEELFRQYHRPNPQGLLGVPISGLPSQNQFQYGGMRQTLPRRGLQSTVVPGLIIPPIAHIPIPPLDPRSFYTIPAPPPLNPTAVQSHTANSRVLVGYPEPILAPTIPTSPLDISRI